ncbi:Ger(x)C family spore germination protein [Clostridium thermarum]|uniref:Ger(x)C family spore germination protein n=1 Tax=Clostridium thermarum TaxID=1716543 RepID=UPI0013D3E1D2|nr:Ger(x)C family spore germination protein [Clostridium thermarum]
MQRKRRTYKIALIILILPLHLCGCWDYMDVEERGYVLGVAIDKSEEVILNDNNPEYMPLEATGEVYDFTIQIPVISRSQSKPYGQSGASAEKPRHWNLTIRATTFFEANRQYATRTDYPPFYSHLQAIVLSEDAAKGDIGKLLDMFLRDPEMRRRTKVFITPGKAKDVLEVIPKIDDYASQYLAKITRNAYKTSRLLHRTDLGKLSEAMHAKSSFVLPRVIATEDEIKDAGCAVFDNNKMVGWLDEIKTKYLKWISGYAKGGIVTLNMPGKEQYPIVLELRKLKTKQKPVVSGDSISMNLDIKAVMNIGEVSEVGFAHAEDDEYIHELEIVAEDLIKRQIESTIDFVKEKYGCDVFFFGRSMRRYEPETWEKVKDNWNEVFQNVKVNVNVMVQIKQLGLIK